MGHSSPPVAGPVLLDNTVLTNFALVGQTDLVRRLWPEAVCTTLGARNEYGTAVSSGLAPAEAWADLSVVTLTEQGAPTGSAQSRKSPHDLPQAFLNASPTDLWALLSFSVFMPSVRQWFPIARRKNEAEAGVPDEADGLGKV